MFKPTNIIILLLSALPLTLASPSQQSIKVNGHTYNPTNTITRDITILGGGSAGTYSAIRLSDLNKTVAVVEATDRLGGNTQTYLDPVTGATVEYGVEVWHPFDVVKAYFERLGVSYGISGFGDAPGSVTEYINFRTGQPNTSLIPSDPTQALGIYISLVSQYPYLDYGWSLPSPIPSDLLLPFGDFVKKYNIQSAVSLIWQYNQGIGNIVTTPTIYVLKYLGISTLQDIQTGFLITTSHDNSALYTSAQKILGNNVFYNSTILDVERSSSGVKVVIKTASGITLIQSKKLIIAIQPTLSNLKFLDLTTDEKSLFKKWKWTQYFSGLLRNSGIPSNTSLLNIDYNAEFHIPAPPNLYGVAQTGVPGLQRVEYINADCEDAWTKEMFERKVIEEVKGVKGTGWNEGGVEWAVSTVHEPFELRVDREDIEEGFYGKLLGLQGKGNTWYISATLHAHDSSLIWRYAEGLLGDITA